MYPQKLPLVTDPLTVRRAASTCTEASVLTSSELDERTSRVAGCPAGKVKRPAPVRVVAVRSAVAPESSRTEENPGRATSLGCAKVLADTASVVSADGDVVTVPTCG